MIPTQQAGYNRLAMQRRKLGYSQRVVARLLGHKSHAALSSYERGRVVPTLATGLRLELILHVPVALLFPGLLGQLESELADHKRRLPGLGQQALFEQRNPHDTHARNS